MSSSPLLTERKPGIFNLPKLAVAGFISRTMAILVDFALIVSAINLIARLEPVEAFFLSIGENAKFLSAYFLFAYFVIFNGPFGRGRTIGKMIMGLRVVDYDNRPITYLQSIKRTLLLYPVFLTWPVVSLIADRSTEFGLYAENLLTSLVQVAVILATFLMIPFNPFKQGMHDYFSQTLVRKIDQSGDFASLCADVGREWPVLHRQPQFSGMLSVALILIFFAYVNHPSQLSEQGRLFRQLLLLPKQDPATPEITVSPRILPTGGFNSNAVWINGDGIPEGDTTPTIIYVFSEPFWRSDENAKQLTSYLFGKYVAEFIAHEAAGFQNARQALEGGATLEAEERVRQSDLLNVIFLYQTQLWLPPSPMPITRERVSIWKQVSLAQQVEIPVETNE